MKTSEQINSLHSGLPRILIESAFGMMVLSAMCSYGTIQNWMISHIPVLTGLINTAGMVVIYYAFLRGMKELTHPLSALWWIAIGMNLLGFVFFCLGESAHGLSAAAAYLSAAWHPSSRLVPRPSGQCGHVDDYPDIGGEPDPRPVLRDRPR